MRYRALDANGDYVIGRSGQFLANSPQCVAQAIMTRLRQFVGEWFLDTSDGTPYMTEILGTGTQNTRDFAIKDRITGTPGVSSILSYQSNVDATRAMTVSVVVDTIYGATSEITFTAGTPDPIFYYNGAAFFDGSQSFDGVLK